MQIALHIGYHKTATTWLQQKIFPNIESENFHYSGRYYYKKKGTDKIPLLNSLFPSPVLRQDRLNKLVNSLSFNNEFDIEKWKNIFYKLLSEGKINLFSHENLLRPYEPKRTAERLNDVLKGADNKVIISIREQRELIRSRYFHDVNLGLFSEYKLSEVLEYENKSVCTWPYCKFTKKNCICRLEDKKIINLKFYNFRDIHTVFTNVFGMDNVHIMVYENLREDPESELKRLFNFLNINLSKETLKKLSKQEVIHKSSGMKNALLKKYAEDFEKCNEIIFEYYKNSNKIIDESLDLSLSNHNYF